MFKRTYRRIFKRKTIRSTGQVKALRVFLAKQGLTPRQARRIAKKGASHTEHGAAIRQWSKQQ